MARLGIIYCAQEFSEKDVLALSSQPQVLKILDKEKTADLEVELKKAVDMFTRQRESEDLLSRVRAQNKVLNELNENLEQIIRQRTEHLEKSKKEIEVKIRDVRELIKFIKSLSSIEGFEDLILILKHEFLKYHKVRSPILIYSISNDVYRCVYFQGQQIVDRPMVADREQITSKDPAKLREILANTLERPISPVICMHLNHSEHNGVFIFEHSMDPIEQRAFMEILDRRMESLTIAFDRLALKWKAHQISKQWSTTFDLLQDPIVIIDGEYNVIRSNAQFAKENERILSKKQVDKEGMPVGFPVREALTTQAGPMGKISVGGKIYEVHAYPIYLGNQEKFFNMIIHYADVTEATNLQSRLVQSEKMSAIGLLAGNIAHELNNPLTGIKSLAQILLTEIPKDSPAYGDLLEVQAAANRSEQIIKNLLEFSSLHGDTVEAVSVRAIITKTMPFLKTALRYHNSFIDLAEGDDTVVAEPHLLQQVIFNLVNNACQAMGDEGDLFLTSKILPASIEIMVRDSGPGVPREIREAIFTPFFTTKEEGKGTGLGLSMSRSIIEKFGGTLTLNEQIEKGSEFVIRLPRKTK
jgi:signal transduction histidine kinase